MMESVSQSDGALPCVFYTVPQYMGSETGVGRSDAWLKWMIQDKRFNAILELWHKALPVGDGTVNHLSSAC